MANGIAPQALEDAVVAHIERTVHGGYNLAGIKATNDTAYAAGDYEQAYRVKLVTNSGNQYVTVDVNQEDGEWKVETVSSTMGS